MFSRSSRNFFNNFARSLSSRPRDSDLCVESPRRVRPASVNSLQERPHAGRTTLGHVRPQTVINTSSRIHNMRFRGCVSRAAAEQQDNTREYSGKIKFCATVF